MSTNYEAPHCSTFSILPPQKIHKRINVDKEEGDKNNCGEDDYEVTRSVF
jgi:hypothetical protein